MDYNPDLIIVRDLFFPLSLAAFKNARELKIPAIHYNQYPLELNEPLVTRIAKKIGLASSTRITPSRTSDMVYNPQTLSWYVPLITTIDYDIQNKEYIPEGTLRLLFIGKYKSKRKNHLLMLQAIAEIKKKRPVHLTMVGSDAHTQAEYFSLIKHQIDSLRISEDVTLVTDVPYDQMSHLYESHDIFVLPSKNEPYAISPLEAMSYGLPVILTDSNGGKKIVLDKQTGCIVPDDDLESLVKAIFEIAESKETLSQMGNSAYTRKKQLYSSDNFITHLNNVITEINNQQNSIL
jgi:glycosyltransferase involved in cell wall biosynthesis